MRAKEKLNLTLFDETRDFLKEVSKGAEISKSRVVDELVKDFNKQTLPLVNYLRKKLGKAPLKK